MRRRLALLALLYAGPVLAQDSALLQRDSLWNSLRLRGDAVALAPLLAEDWLLTHSDGRTQDKTDYLRELASRQRTNSHVENRGLRVRVFGETAVITGISIQSGMTGAQPWSGRFRFTRTWVRHEGTWVMVASHSSRCGDTIKCD